jgi:hypothetical protein
VNTEAGHPPIQGGNAQCNAIYLQYLIFNNAQLVSNLLYGGLMTAPGTTARGTGKPASGAEVRTKEKIRQGALKKKGDGPLRIFD